MVSRRTLYLIGFGFLIWGVVIFFGGDRTVFVAPGQHDVIAIETIEREQYFYGSLDDAPHTYTFTISTTTTISLQIIVPDTVHAQNDKSGLLLESLPDDAGVREVRRLPAKNAGWNHEYHWRMGQTYRVGPSYYDALEPGTYLFEVSTPVNLGPYVLRVGTEDTRIGYIAAVRDVVRANEFFLVPRMALMKSPLIVAPLLVVLMCCVVGITLVRRWWHLRR